MGDTAGLRFARSGGGETTVNTSAVRAFESSLKGKAIHRNDARYDEARAVWNGIIDRRPSLIVQCEGADDVAKAVRFVRDHDLLVSIRGGGHNVAGNAVCDDGLVIDLSQMRQVFVDANQKQVRVEGGALLGDLDRETQRFGLVVPSGVVSLTGIAGLTLTGGISWVSRKHGMGVDSLLAVDVVTPDGTLRHASETENADLFWAIRGGGGNFGVITAFEFRAYPLGPIVAFAGPTYALEDATAVVRGWRDFTRRAPDEVTSMVLFWTPPGGSPLPPVLHDRAVVTIGAMYAGPVEEGQRVLAELGELAEPLADIGGALPFVAVQSAMDGLFPAGMRAYWKSVFTNELSDEAIDVYIERAKTRPHPRIGLPLRHTGGAISRVPDGATAVAHRSAQYLASMDACWTEAKDDQRCIAWVRDFWEEFSRFSADGGVYLNFMETEGRDVVRAGFGGNYDRLAALKGKYDPQNLFHLNQNIRPASAH